MPNINSLTYNGMKSTDLGVYVTGSGSFDAAEMDADKYEIAGRNGDLIIPKNRYKNIVVTYPAFIPKAFQEKAQSIRNWMRSAKAYARLEDTYDMEHYRLGLASGIQSFEPVNRNDASNFQLSFDCKPQRFLKTGETPLPIEPEAHSYSGEIVEFETVAVDDMTKAEVSLLPIQSLNGYDHPWAGGAGKNKLPLDIAMMKSLNTNGTWSGNAFAYNGITYTVNDDGTVKVNGTASGISQLIFYDELVSCPFNGYILTGCPTGGGNTTFDLRVSDITSGSSSDYGTGATINLSATGKWRCILFVRSGATINNLVFKPMIRASGTDATFEPYENLCPISGHTGATLNVTGKMQFHCDTSGLISTSDGYTVTANPYWGYSSVFIPVSSIYLTASATRNLKLTLYFYDADKNFKSTFQPLASTTTYVMTLANDVAYIRVALNINGVEEAFSADLFDKYKIMLNWGITVEPFVPYSGTSYPVSFGQTVYGGTFDFVSGKLVVTHELKTLTGSSDFENWSFQSGDNYYQFANWVDQRLYGNATAPLSDSFQTMPLSDRGVKNGIVAYNDSGYRFCVLPDFGVTTLAEWKTWLSAHNVQLYVPLKTPIEIDLDPTEVQTLLGLNNVWASDGTVEINYADPFNVDNPTYFEARPLFEITNPAQNDVLNVNGKTITFLSSYTGTVTIDCETMDCFSGYTNLNYLISATDFLVLNEGVNIVTWSGSGTCKMTPRWWEL